LDVLTGYWIQMNWFFNFQFFVVSIAKMLPKSDISLNL